MSKRRIFLLIPIAIIAGFLIYTWFLILSTNLIATWRHYTGLILFAPVLYFLFRNFKIAVLATGIYLIIGTFNLLSITTDVLLYNGVRIISVELTTSFFQPKLFLIFIIYIIFNYDALIDIWLDYKEAQELKKK